MGAKGRKKKNNTPESCKEQGNQAFQIGDLPRALQQYTKGLELDPNHSVILSNRSGVYVAMHQYEDALQDALQAIQANPGWPKAYYRKAVALLEMGMVNDSYEAVQEGLSVNSESPELLELLKTVQEEKDQDNALPPEHPERAKFDNLLSWLKEGGAEFPKLKLKFYSEDYRGVHAGTFIPKNDCILYVPKSHIITLEMAYQTPIGSKMKKARLNLLSPKHCFLSSFILQETRKPDSFWKPYIEVLPEHFRSFPIFYTDEEKEWLAGSPFLDQIEEKIQDIQEDYETICNAVPEFAEFSVPEFSKFRMAVSSRIFGMEIDGVKTDGFVPYADMLNHRRPRQTSWTFDQERQGFIIETLEDVPRGSEVMDSYGKKCNTRFLLNYGFIVRNNDANEYPFRIKLDENDPLFGIKRGLLQGRKNDVLRVQADLEERVFQEFFGLLRFVLLEDESIIPELIQNCHDEHSMHFKPGKLGPISPENEQKVLLHVKKLSEEGLKRYPNSLEEDKQILLEPSLTENNVNCVLMRMGEKEILDWFVNLAETCLPLFEMNKKDAKKAAKGNVYDTYITHVIIPMLKK
mmetsp:Transcript_13974/g.20442  ORF Transcript_13974/g.20442 Transcript_13974/m.20442 type:complete len:576 (+) Transcript_13974:330-2057(+)